MVYSMMVSLLGSGTPMFKALDDKLSLSLLDSRTFGSDVVDHYARADEGR